MRMRGKTYGPAGQSHAVRRVRKRARQCLALFAGAWGVPNKQSERPEGTERWKGISVKDIPFHCLQKMVHKYMMLI